jgi:hypothetical protein
MQQDKTERGAALREAGMRQHDRLIDVAAAVSRRNCGLWLQVCHVSSRGGPKMCQDGCLIDTAFAASCLA